MNSEQFVRKYYPNATVEKYKVGGFMMETFWRVVENDTLNAIHFSRSESKSNAWVQAKKDIQAERGI